MDLPDIVSATLGLSPPWHVSSVTLADDGKRLDIIVCYDANHHAVCPHCGARGAGCEADSEIWYHRDFFRYATYLHTRVPRIICCGLVHTVERPWARTGSKFVKISNEQNP
ncbi:MAG: hypothetical protein FIB02_00320 [Desulfuromonas sp.]|nr:hypothetical protein [Desulfuromonas sp.]